MEAKSLRIGNWVIDPLGEKWVSICKSDFADNTYLRRIKPIPITSEWLERFGFTENPLSYSLVIGDRTTLKVSINEPGKYYLMVEQDRDIVSLCRTLQHVHQIQNLIFDLTGKELQLKQPVKQ